MRIDAGSSNSFASAMCTSEGRNSASSHMEAWQIHGVPTVDGIIPLRKAGSFFAIRDAVVRLGGKWIHVDDADDLLWQAISATPLEFSDRVAMFADLLRATPHDRVSAIHALSMLGVSV